MIAPGGGVDVFARRAHDGRLHRRLLRFEQHVVGVAISADGWPMETHRVMSLQ